MAGNLGTTDSSEGPQHAEHEDQGFLASHVENGQNSSQSIAAQSPSTTHIYYNLVRNGARTSDDSANRRSDQHHTVAPSERGGSWWGRGTIVILIIPLTILGALAIVLSVVLTMGRNSTGLSESQNSAGMSSPIIVSTQSSIPTASTLGAISSTTPSTINTAQTGSINGDLPNSTGIPTSSSSMSQSSPTHICCGSQPSAATAALPQITADGLYLLNFNSSNVQDVRGSAMFWYSAMSLQNNIDASPGDSAVVRLGEYYQWVQANITGFFNQADVFFTAIIDKSLDEVESMPINSVVGYGWNGNNTSGQKYRDFIIFKGNGERLYRNETSGLEYFAEYYAA